MTDRLLMLCMAALCLVLAGCDKVVSDQPVGAPWVQTQTESCTHLGYGYACGFDWKNKYGESGTEREEVRAPITKTLKACS